MRSASFGVPITVLAPAFLASCGGPSYVRDSDKKNIDEYAMSTGLDRRDIDRLYKENIDKLLASAIVAQWKKDAPVVAVFPIANETSEHVDSQLEALLSTIETDLVNSAGAQVVDRDLQKRLIGEVEQQRGGAFDPNNAAQYGKQLGARFFVTGKLNDSAERSGEERRVQYFLFMKVVDVETGAIRWQNKAELTKGLVN
ncbi:MAG: penicillin-binding protein activator LpoB [Myxococcota bacterium]